MINSKVLIGTTMVRNSAHALESFLENQKAIQITYPNSHLVISTDEDSYIYYLKYRLKAYELNGSVVLYNTTLPHLYAEQRAHSMVAGREAIREFAINHSFDYLLSLDSDMTYDTNIINILLSKSTNSVVMSGYKLRDDSFTISFSLGCILFPRYVFKKILFRCKEFSPGKVLKNPNILQDGTMLEFDLFTHRIRTVKGIFLKIDHYITQNKKISISPRYLSLFEKLRLHPFIRGLIVSIFYLTRRDIPRIIHKLKEL